MNIALIGYGNMGKRIHDLSEERGHQIELILDENNNVDGDGITNDAFRTVDVAIDFSHPEAAPVNIKKVLQTGTPVVVGTTGWLDQKKAIQQFCKDRDGRLLYGSNFSIGVQLFAKLIERAGELFGGNKMFDVSLHEVHHTNKADAPSGTALTLAERWINGSSGNRKAIYGVPEKGRVDKDKFYITSQRLGSVFGEHQLRVNSFFDDIEITHRARSRDAFASGAIKAAEWLYKHQQPGFYLIEDIVEELS
jgi:4-hydroxy-tetrahydrodipicolinate reductase